MTEGVSYNTHNFGQQAPIQSAQDQRTNQGMAPFIIAHPIACEVIIIQA